MKKLLLTSILSFGLLSAWNGSAQAAMRTMTLSVPGMSCEVCPITVKKALQKVSGVDKVDVSFEKKEAVVTYDDTKTTMERLIKATADAGYPSFLKAASSVKGEGK